jgi:hypothetical protein
VLGGAIVVIVVAAPAGIGGALTRLLAWRPR